ncbi:hypothetical protein [Wenzhouxiangella sediminis]|uniref:Exo-alpha-sialidase n=1 Tax=Wenzhouxiangella sediminis TaxID=1792836 RepID=A0A3E1K6S6_9GAMM|nr:hypothetical protein [Wenzhouxiangella sediminis]RFF29673.1 hypothetical protein DZC52_11310 [Wenzhouxiangella sediminis]
MNFKTALLRAAWLACLLSLLTACVTDPFIDTRPDDLAALPQDYGVVAVQVTNNAERLSPTLDTWTAAHVVDLDNTENRFRLEPAGTGLLGSRVFVGALPPGHYRMYNMYSSAVLGDVSVWMHGPIPRSLGTFRIEANHLTSLGTVVFQPLGEFEADGESRTAHVFARLDEQEDLLGFVETATPELIGDLDEGVHGWEFDSNSGQRAELAERIEEFAVGTSHHWLDDGRVAMTGPMGSILVREGLSDWRRIDTGFTQQLSTLVDTGHGYIAAGERGLVLQADFLDGEWSAAPGPGNQAAIEWIGTMENGSLYAIAQAGDTTTLFHVEAESRQWEPVLDFHYEQGIFFTGRGEVHARKLADDRLVTFADGRRLVLDDSGGILEDQEDRHIFFLVTQPDGVTLALPGSAWSGVGDQLYSHDVGASWKEAPDDWPRESDRFDKGAMVLVLPDGKTMAFSHKGEYNDFLKRWKYEDNPRLRVSGPDGNILEWGVEIEEQCSRMLPQISTAERVFARCDDGRLMVSEDRGQSWIEDFAPGRIERPAPEDQDDDGTI